MSTSRVRPISAPAIEPTAAQYGLPLVEYRQNAVNLGSSPCLVPPNTFSPFQIRDSLPAMLIIPSS